MPEPLRLPAPGSKSQTQRALVLAALAAGESQLLCPLDCDDSSHLRRALVRLGAEIEVQAGMWRIRGGSLRPPTGPPLWCGDGGTTLRFLAPLSLLLHPGEELALDGSKRLAERPLAGMEQALGMLGVSVRRLVAGRGLPLTLQRRSAQRRQVTVEASRSSQFASGLLMSGPLLPEGLELELSGEPVSRPYLDLTLAAMAAFGARVRARQGVCVVESTGYRPCTFQVEGDWSAGALLLAAGWITGRAVQVPNLDPTSLQGDRAIVGFLRELDRPRPHTFDLASCPDLVAPLAAACAVARFPSEISGAAHTRLKESDRLAVLARGLGAAGARVQPGPDGLRLEPAPLLRPALLDPAGDHRMAMAFGLLSLREPGIRVADPGCVSKSYPGFWQDLERLR